MKMLLKVVCCLGLVTSSVNSTWDFAVTTKTKIEFYDDTWALVRSAAHEFDDLSALTFDETEEKLYFSDRLHNNASIFSLKVSPVLKQTPSSGDLIEGIVARIQNETISGIAYDPLEQQIFWTDLRNQIIYRAFLHPGKSPVPEVLLDLKTEDSYPDGIAIDICRRKLYWTNSNHKKPSVERSNLNGEKREKVVDTKLYLPHGIVVDQFDNRIYWVVDQQGIRFSVESAKLDGSDRRTLVDGLNNVPYNLAVTKDNIYWTDLTHNSVWSTLKFSELNLTDGMDAVVKVRNFTSSPKGIVSRIGIMTKLENDPHCRDVVKKVKQRMLDSMLNIDSSQVREAQIKKDMFCLNKGEFNPTSESCICAMGYTGLRCETRECHNFCVHGTCQISKMGFPKCTCQKGFEGDRCEIFKCNDYCLNDGKCEIVEDFETGVFAPKCRCSNYYMGNRCEHNTTEVCSVFCRLLEYNPDTEVPFGCHDICEEIPFIDKDLLSISAAKHMKQINDCNTKFNATIIFAVSGVVIALIIVFCIVKVIKRLYKPARPRIKKTFVVQKNFTQTPLTSRPLTAEQCEITIENCCNMNICDTPCFDPKLLQQSMSKSTKEDKKMLLNNTDDLY